MCESIGKADLLSNHFDSKQSREAVDLPFTCHPSPSRTTFAFRSREVRRLLLDLDPYGGTDQLGMFPLFLNRTADVIDPCRRIVLCPPPFSLFVCIVSCLAGDRPMSPQLRKVHRCPLLPITGCFPQHQYSLRCLNAWCRFVLNDLWNAVVSFQPPSLLIGKGLVPVMHFCECPIHC